MNFTPQRGRGRAAVTIDITALIDVVFLLLIFLLVTTTFRKDDHAFMLDLPTSSAEEVQVTVDKTAVFVDRKGGLHLLVISEGSTPDAKPSPTQAMSQEVLTSKLKALYTQDPNREIAIRGEKEANFQRMVDVIAVVKDVGFRRIWFPYDHAQPRGPD